MIAVAAIVILYYNNAQVTLSGWCMSKVSKGLYIKTYGCQMNTYDSQKIADMMQVGGYHLVSDVSDANVVLVNTCNIREKATEKLYSELGRIRDRGSKAILVVAGCVAQAEGEEVFRRAKNVDIVVGPQSIHKLPSLIEEVKDKQIKAINLDFPLTTKFDFLPREQHDVGVSAFLSIQEGCDKFCHFCCVPYTRGAEYSRPVSDIELEARALVAKGAKELVLLGQNVNAYNGLDGAEKSNLGKLLRRLACIEGLLRLRYTSSHPLDMHDDLYDAHASIPQVMPFLHLPVQSGSDRILRLMNRKHNAEQYLEIIDRMRQCTPGIQFSSDFIVGYPGETDDDFERTVDLVEKVEYAQAFSFKYSPRFGTPAAAREETVGVPEEIKHKRLLVLQEALDVKQKAANLLLLNKEVSVLFERRTKNDQLVGRTPHMQLVYSDGPDHLIGQELKVKINKCFDHSVVGEVVRAQDTV